MSTRVGIRYGRRGASYLELLVSVVILAITGAAAVATWGWSVRVPATKRLAEMGSYLAVTEMERLKALKYANLVETAPASPSQSYFGPSGAPVPTPVARGFQVLSWTTTQDSNADGARNAADLREVVVEVWNNDRTQRYERLQTLLTAGGV